ncbi:DUF805 domain-containing protein [Hymenobacter sp. BT523]|uniref:DUF805 domain-containing protein n=1 Tax=Hymenobacter sp. BT523 TaxID=2795725 RepID=UPI00293D1F63|nr:DUF805 domain-containing protein [Hymenobacter sp. BT523]
MGWSSSSVGMGQGRLTNRANAGTQYCELNSDAYFSPAFIRRLCRLGKWSPEPTLKNGALPKSLTSRICYPIFFMQYFLQALRNYAVFSGRARRKEYWMFVLFQLIFGIVAMTLDSMLGLAIAPLPYGYIYVLFSLAMLLPGLSLAVRRLHDVNKSGLFLLIAFIPLVGAIWLLVLMCTEGTPGDNQYGPNPKGQVLAF